VVVDVLWVMVVVLVLWVMVVGRQRQQQIRYALDEVVRQVDVS
jgi:hypothetical protein